MTFSTYRYKYSRFAPGLFFSGNAAWPASSKRSWSSKEKRAARQIRGKKNGRGRNSTPNLGVVESESYGAYVEASANYLVQSSRFQVPGSTLNLELLLNIEQGKPLNREL